MKPVILPCIMGLLLAACSDASRHQSPGFSGLGSEPGVSKSNLVDPRLSSGTLHSDIPVRSVRSGSQNRAEHATLAIRKASGSGFKSKPVQVGHQSLALSVMYVNAIPYAVLKPKSGLFAANIVPETSATFAANAVALTGCPAASQVYSYGPQPNRPQGMTIALACSG